MSQTYHSAIASYGSAVTMPRGYAHDMWVSQSDIALLVPIRTWHAGIEMR